MVQLVPLAKAVLVLQVLLVEMLIADLALKLSRILYWVLIFF
jgi:hypothetical protein